VTILVPVHRESNEILGESFASMSKLKSDEKVDIWILPSFDLDFNNIHKLLPENSDNIHFHLTNYECISKAEKIMKAIPDLESDYFAIIDADHTCDENWLNDSFESIRKAGPLCVGCQGIRKLRGKKNIISLWDSFSNHFGNEVINIFRSYSKLNIPFTGTSALFKSFIMKEIPFENHLTEDTNWFMNLRLKTKYFLTYQRKSATYELLPTKLFNLIQRRMRWVTGHNKAYFDKSPLRHLSNLDHTSHGAFYLATGAIFISILLRSSFVFSQLSLFAQLFILSTVLFFSYFRVHLILALIPIIIVSLTEQVDNFFFVFYGQAQDIFFAEELFYTFLVIYLIQFFIILLTGIVCGLYRKEYILSIMLLPLLIIIEVYVAFVGLLNFSNRDKTWNVYKKSKVTYIHLIVSSALLILAGLYSLDFMQNLYKSTPIIFGSKKSTTNYRTNIDGRHIEYDGKPYFVRGIVINTMLNKSKMDAIIKAGFNTLRFYHMPGKKTLDLLSNYNTKIIVQAAKANWGRFRLNNTQDYYAVQSSYLEINEKMNKMENILFPVFGNEMEVWPLSLRSHLETDVLFGRIHSICDRLNSLFSKYSNKSFLFGYSSIFSLCGNLDLQNIPIVMLNTNAMNLVDWTIFKSKMNLETKPLIINEYGGRWHYFYRGKKFYEPVYMRNFLLAQHYHMFVKEHVAGLNYFAMEDGGNDPRMNEYTDPFVTKLDTIYGLLDSKGNKKEAYWLMADLQNMVKVVRIGKHNYIHNNYDKNIVIKKINTKEVFIELSALSKERIPSTLLQEENYVQYILDGKAYERVLFKSSGYITGCLSRLKYEIKEKDKNQYEITLKRKSNFEYVHLNLDIKPLHDSNLDELPKMRLLKNGSSVYHTGINIKGFIFTMKDSEKIKNLKISSIEKCRKGSPLI
jgi:hypothetical protein